MGSEVLGPWGYGLGRIGYGSTSGLGILTYDPSGWALDVCEALRGVQYDLINQSINQCYLQVIAWLP